MTGPCLKAMLVSLKKSTADPMSSGRSGWQSSFTEDKAMSAELYSSQAAFTYEKHGCIACPGKRNSHQELQGSQVGRQAQGL